MMMAHAHLFKRRRPAAERQESFQGADEGAGDDDQHM
jgi:hypothetical protein